MLLREEYSKELLKEKLEEYKNIYSDIMNYKIENALSFQLCDGFSKDIVTSEMNQFYHEYGLISDRLNIYYKFRDLLKEIYDLKSRRVVDVGAGQVPQFARELAKVSEHVIAVDRLISQRNNPYDNLSIVEGEFNNETTLGENNLLVGCEPCQATMDIVNQAARNDVDFAIVVCDCTYMKINDNRFNKWNEYASKIDEIVYNSNLGEVHRSTLLGKPFIYTNKRGM